MKRLILVIAILLSNTIGLTPANAETNLSLKVSLPESAAVGTTIPVKISLIGKGSAKLNIMVSYANGKPYQGPDEWKKNIVRPDGPDGPAFTPAGAGYVGEIKLVGGTSKVINVKLPFKYKKLWWIKVGGWDSKTGTYISAPQSYITIK